jgi:serine O-acetyltransferase
MFSDLRADLARYLELMDPRSSPTARAVALCETQGVWATAVYRFGRWVRERVPSAVAPPLSLGYRVLTKLVEVAAGIQLPASARVGPGLYIGHFGSIVVHPDAVLGADCNLSQGVTIGVLGGGRAGAPVLGDGVYVGAGAKILGPVVVGDGARIGANAVVVRDVLAGATAVGVPAHCQGQIWASSASESRKQLLGRTGSVRSVVRKRR